ncbi:hypothetical protein HN51_068316 [Arachis hypogaea]|nr:uncharacterized protein DS421_5g138120 [Arachis hypogaea]QHO42267.1 uncharacterized protein DS421_5g152670 [Arachis hypogaea]
MAPFSPSPALPPVSEHKPLAACNCADSRSECSAGESTIDGSDSVLELCLQPAVEDYDLQFPSLCFSVCFGISSTLAMLLYLVLLQQLILEQLPYFSHFFCFQMLRAEDK